MKRFLPPLLVLLVLTVVAVRWAQEPARAEARERIAGLVQGGGFEEATAELERYATRYDGEDDIWFTTWAWFRLSQPARALEAVWGHPTLPSQPDTARRFARTGLYAVGWEDEARKEATKLEPFSLVALAEGTDTWAHQRLRAHARDLELMATTSYFFPSYRRATRRPLEMIVEEYRTRDDMRFDVAAAIGSLRGQDYPEAAADEARLIKVLGDDKWRRSFRDVWCVSALALGRSGTPAALAALDAAAKELDGSVNELDQQDLKLVYVGMLASGNWDIHDKIAPAVYEKDAVMVVTVWYLEALIHRYLAGDGNSDIWLRRMWEGPGARFGGLRGRVARAFLLQDQPPTDEALKTWVGRMLHDLEDPKAPLISHVLARSFRLRQGLPEAREQLLDLLRQIAARFKPGDASVVDLSEPFIEGLRALYLYDGA